MKLATGIITAAFILVASGTADALGNTIDFTKSCEDDLELVPGLNDYVLKATCTGRDKQDYKTELSLNGCIANNIQGGVMEWKDPQGLFGTSCNKCSLSGKERNLLTCACNASNGKRESSQINLDKGIGNNNGVLQCGSVSGTRSLT
ncbi:hypothetical protein JMJ77_0012320 [Colletotrichum scovillei]|uniref:Cyanovirin-N domain-containing protein n=1 Tax=Colletotrichum scovillei TaxID=1209932 RepID=A0A9P7UBT8_9PEZI|nr:hypothetical protein JMJ78_0001375 [Colletotrichum scovillei]KAG7041802.1 hypothetical protein JMJ77_0012320 [Colletotrichum scovillei]KAG7061833.1 hypothetical protein JMJ76_0003789 [Colletotrichum scovillei]